MDYLSRASAPFSEDLWAQIDKAVIDTAKKHMICRRFLNLFGPLGPGATTVLVDSLTKGESFENGFAQTTGRRIAELPLMYEDFTLFSRDLEYSCRQGYPTDLSAAIAASQKCAKREDDLILNGNKALGVDGLLTVKGSHKIKRGNWKEGEDAYKNIAEAISYFASHSLLGRYALVLSPDLYLDLQRLIPSVGIIEIDRIAKLVNGRVYTTGPYGSSRAVIVCAEPQYMDLAVGMDLSVGYLELKDLNHSLRIVETVALRIKNPEAIVCFEA